MFLNKETYASSDGMVDELKFMVDDDVVVDDDDDVVVVGTIVVMMDMVFGNTHMY